MPNVDLAWKDRAMHLNPAIVTHGSSVPEHNMVEILSFPAVLLQFIYTRLKVHNKNINVSACKKYIYVFGTKASLTDLQSVQPAQKYFTFVFILYKNDLLEKVFYFLTALPSPNFTSLLYKTGHFGGLNKGLLEDKHTGRDGDIKETR